MMLLAMITNKRTKDADTLGHRKQKGFDRVEVTRVGSLGNHVVPTTEYREACESIGSSLENSVRSM